MRSCYVSVHQSKSERAHVLYVFTSQSLNERVDADPTSSAAAAPKLAELKKIPMSLADDDVKPVLGVDITAQHVSLLFLTAAVALSHVTGDISVTNNMIDKT